MEARLNLQEFLVTGINWQVAGMFAFSLFCIAVAGFSAAGFSQFVKKIWAYIRLNAHPGLQSGKTWIVWGTSTGSFPVLLSKIGVNTVTLVGSGKTIYSPILHFDGLPKVTIDQKSQEDAAVLTQAEKGKILQVVNDLHGDDLTKYSNE